MFPAVEMQELVAAHQSVSAWGQQGAVRARQSVGVCQGARARQAQDRLPAAVRCSRHC